MSDDAQILANHLITLSIVDYDDVFVKSATELRRLDALVKEQAQEIERLRAQPADEALRMCRDALTLANGILGRVNMELLLDDRSPSLHLVKAQKDASAAIAAADAALSHSAPEAPTQRGPQAASAPKAQFYVRVSNISWLPSGVFLPNADGSAPDVELKSESLVPVVSAQRVPLTKDQLIDEFCRTPDLHQLVSAFFAGARFAEAAHGIHPLQRLADLSKEIGEKL